MSVSSFLTDDRFVVRVIKAHNDNPSDTWANSYEFKATVDGSEAQLLILGNVVVEFERLMHKNVVGFKRLTISTWEADSVPYDPESFISVNLNAVGAIGVVSGVAPLNECLSVARVCATGRFGHIFLRGVLDTADVGSPAGKAILIDVPNVQGNIDDAITGSDLADYLGVAPDGPFTMSLINKTGTQVRSVIGLSAAGVSFLPLDHAWFNRT